MGSVSQAVDEASYLTLPGSGLADEQDRLGVASGDPLDLHSQPGHRR
jgi:hypothetical protein